MINAIGALLHAILLILDSNYFHVNCIYDWDENDVQCFDYRGPYQLFCLGFRVDEDVPIDLLEATLQYLLDKHKGGDFNLVHGVIDVYHTFPNEVSIYWYIYLMP